jgi:hypothetical protein
MAVAQVALIQEVMAVMAVQAGQMLAVPVEQDEGSEVVIRVEAEVLALEVEVEVRELVVLEEMAEALQALMAVPDLRVLLMEYCTVAVEAAV